MKGLLIEFAALAIYGPLVVILHELGHVLFARVGGYRVTAFAIGLGRPIWRVRLGRGPVIVFNQWLLAGGACTAIPTRPPGPRRAWYHAGGLLAQAGLAVGLFASPSMWWAHRAANFNGLVAATNALPWRFTHQALQLSHRSFEPRLLMPPPSPFWRL